MREESPNRKSFRKRLWDYTAAAWYFITINTKGGRALFGTIVNGRMVLSEAGRVAEDEWRKSAAIRRNIELDEFVVMPNHVHGIVKIGHDAGGFGAPNPCEEGGEGLAREGLARQTLSAEGGGAREGHDASCPCGGGPRREFGKPIAGALGTFVGAYKAAVSRGLRHAGLMREGLAREGLARQTRTAAGASAVWHRNYWDVILEDEKALANIRKYIRFNPQNYDVVMNSGEARFLGDKALMDNRQAGFLASRGTSESGGRLVVRSGEAIISGFLSPAERMVLRDGLKNRTPLIWIKPWGLQEKDAAIQRAIDEGRLLIVSPFNDAIKVPSMRRAAWCNQYVLAHCDRLIVGCLNRGGMLDCILSEANPALEITYL